MLRRPPFRLRHAAPPAVLSLAALLAGCATTASRTTVADSSVPVPAGWAQTSEPNTTTSSPDLSAWWQRFDDPVLTRLVSDSLAHNPDVRTALSRIAQARSSRAIEKSGFFPSLTGGVSGSGRRTRDHDANTTTTSDSYSASLDASWEIDLFGKQRLALSAADSDLLQTEENFRAAQASLSAEVALAYLNLRSTEAQLDVVRRSLLTREDSTRLTQWSEDAGIGDVLATRQAISSLEQARASVPSLEQTLVETRNQLAVLSGRPPGTLDELLATTAKIPVAPADLATGIPADTLRQRPDIRAAAHAVEAASTRSIAARRDRLPTLTLTGSLGVQAGSLGNLVDPASTIASVAGGLVAPIFNAGRITQNIRIQDETTRQALIAYEAGVLDALSEAENALSAIRRQTERRDALERAAVAAREADELARQQYEAGAVDYLQVLDSERTLLSVEQSLVSTAADLGAAHVRLYKALGGGWNPERPDPSVLDATVPSQTASATSTF